MVVGHTFLTHRLEDLRITIFANRKGLLGSRLSPELHFLQRNFHYIYSSLGGHFSPRNSIFLLEKQKGVKPTKTHREVGLIWAVSPAERSSPTAGSWGVQPALQRREDGLE